MNEVVTQLERGALAGSCWLQKRSLFFNSKMFLFCNLDASISVINSSIPAGKPLARG